jgi:spermidine synthase
VSSLRSPVSVYLLFFLSGFAGLVYEISWSRQIGLLFGNTAQAAAVVLGTYFCGLALGSWIAARMASRIERPLVGYGAAELLVALWAMLTPVLLGLFRAPAIAALLNSDNLLLQTAARALASFVILLLATVPLGTTLPFISQHLSPTDAPRPHRIALAYALNTAGALVGSLAATYALLLYVGVARSSYLAAGISALCGLSALVLGWQGRAAERPRLASHGKERISSGVYTLACISGFGTLGLQALHARLFALLLHNSTYTFGTIVLVSLGALALAGWVVSRSRHQSGVLAAWGMLLGGVSIPATVLLLRALTDFDYLASGGGFIGYMASALGLVTLTVFPPIFLLGLVLPDLLASQRAAAGSGVGRLVGANTLAATVGVIVAAFVLIPLLGLWLSLAAFSLMYCMTGLLALPRQHAKHGAVWTVPLLTLAACWQVTGVPRDYAARARRDGYEYAYLRETPYGQIDVLSNMRDGTLALRQNRFYTLGTSASIAPEVRQGVLPLRLHPAPRHVAFLGLATGITAGAAVGDQRVEDVTAVELIPQVVEAARLFSDYNSHILDDPRAHVVVNDARHYLYAGSSGFDVIVSDLFVPWHSETGYLYTVEHYRTASSRLADGGLFFQWLPAYQLSADQLSMIADTFAAVFPCTTVWVDEGMPGYPVVGLCGSNSMIAAPLDMRGFYAGDWHMHSGAPLNTDEHPRVEFLAPIADLEGRKMVGAQWEEFKQDVLGPLPKGGIAFNRLKTSR